MNGPSPARSPLYEAYNAPRYERQSLIREYQGTYSCRLVVMADAIFPYNIAPFEETLYDADPNQNLHVMFCTQGGDGETALRLVRQAQSRCKELVVIVPEQAKSAGTLFALGADHIYMGPTSDLGPIDPQFQLSGNSTLVAGKTIIDAVEDAEDRIQKNPETYPPSRVVVERHHRDISTTSPGCNCANGAISCKRPSRAFPTVLQTLLLHSQKICMGRL